MTTLNCHCRCYKSDLTPFELFVLVQSAVIMNNFCETWSEKWTPISMRFSLDFYLGTKSFLSRRFFISIIPMFSSILFQFWTKLYKLTLLNSVFSSFYPVQSAYCSSFLPSWGWCFTSYFSPWEHSWDHSHLIDFLLFWCILRGIRKK